LTPKSVRTTHMSPEQVKQKVIEISTSFQVITKYTSYVAVEERSGEAAEEAMKKVEIQANGSTPIEATPPIAPRPVPYIHRHPVYVPQGHHLTPNGRTICRVQHWVPPPPPPVAHVAPPSQLNVSFSSFSFAPSFASNRKKKKDKGDHISGGGARSSSYQITVHDAQSSSQLGFALHSQDEEADFDDSPLESLLKQAPAHFKLAAPAPSFSDVSQSQNLAGLSDHKGEGQSKEKSAKKREEGKKGLSPRSPPGIALSPPQLSHVTLAPTPTASVGPTGPRPHGSPHPPPPPPGALYPKRGGRGGLSAVESDLSDCESEVEQVTYDGTHSLRSKKANSMWKANDMVPNKPKLAYKSIPEVAAAPEHLIVPTQAPDGWSFMSQFRVSSSSSPPHSPHTTTATQLRKIVTTQHANGCWDIGAASLLLHLDLDELYLANPLTTTRERKKKPVNEEANQEEEIKKGGKKEGKKEGKTPKSARKGHDKDKKHDRDAESPRKDTGKGAKTNDAISAATSANQSSSSLSKSTTELLSAVGLESDELKIGDVSIDDIWATVLLLAYLRLNYDSEKDFWTFVALKVSSLLAKTIPDDTARKSLMKKAKSFLESLPVASASPKSPRAASP